MSRRVPKTFFAIWPLRGPAICRVNGPDFNECCLHHTKAIEAQLGLVLVLIIKFYRKVIVLHVDVRRVSQVTLYIYAFIHPRGRVQKKTDIHGNKYYETLDVMSLRRYDTRQLKI